MSNLPPTLRSLRQIHEGQTVFVRVRLTRAALDQFGDWEAQPIDAHGIGIVGRYLYVNQSEIVTVDEIRKALGQ